MSSDKIAVPLPDFDDIEVDVGPAPNPNPGNDIPTWNPEDGIKLEPIADEV